MSSLKTVKAPGRIRDAECTRNMILEAAETEFARAGLAGARTENIAEMSGVTRAMIHYYYDSKEKLYQAVLEKFLRARVEAIQKINLNDPDVTNAVTQFVRSFILQQQDNVSASSIMLFEAVQNHGRYYKEIAIAAIYEPLVALLKRGMEEGVFRKVDPLHVTINIIGISVFYFCARENVKHLFPPGTDLMSDVEVNKHLEEALEMVLNGLKVH